MNLHLPFYLKSLQKFAFDVVRVIGFYQKSIREKVNSLKYSAIFGCLSSCSAINKSKY